MVLSAAHTIGSASAAVDLSNIIPGCKFEAVSECCPLWLRVWGLAHIDNIPTSGTAAHT